MECGEHQSTKPQKPSSRKAPKSQAPNQGPSDVVAIQGGGLRFGAWNFTGPSSAVAACRILPQRHVCYGGWKFGAWDSFHRKQQGTMSLALAFPINRFTDAIKRVENKHLLK